jgi:hypothetical protein
LPNMMFYGIQAVLDNEVKNYELRKKIWLYKNSYTKELKD